MQILPPLIQARMAEIAVELYPLCCRGRQVLNNIPPVSLHFLVKIAPSCISVQEHEAFGITVCTAGRKWFSSTESRVIYTVSL